MHSNEKECFFLISQLWDTLVISKITFLEITIVGKPISFLREFVSFPKWIHQTGPADWKHFWKCFGNSKHFWKCFGNSNVGPVYANHFVCIVIRLTIVITSVPYIPCCYAQIIIVSINDDLRPHWPPPLLPPSLLPWMPHCCHHHQCHHCHCRCHCHGCRHLRRHQHRFCCYCYRFLVDCCLPLRCLCFGHRCLPSRLPLLAADAIATVIAAANRCSLLLLPQPRSSLLRRAPPALRAACPQRWRAGQGWCSKYYFY